MTVAVPEPSKPASNTGLSPEERAAIKIRFERGEACEHCKGLHSRACPRVRRMAFHSNGALAEVEFWPAGKWPEDHILWPEDLTADQ